jgi:hypothetical protein
MTREEWRARLEARRADAERVEAFAPLAKVLGEVLAELEQVDGWPSAPDRMLTLDETAARLNVPKRWLTEHRQELPFLKVYTAGGTVRASERALARWLAAR